MPLYRWKGISFDGAFVHGEIISHSDDELKNLLLMQHIALLDVKTHHQSVSPLSLLSRRINEKELSNICQQLALLIDNGIELVHALNTVKHQTKKRMLRSALINIQHLVERGNPLHEALNHHKALFPTFVISLISVGEQTGTLGHVLKNIAHNLDQKFKLKQEVKHAAQTPIITLSVAFILISCIIIFIMPQFISLYQSLGKQLPYMTKRLFELHTTLASKQGLLILGACCFGIVTMRYLLYVQKIKLLFHQFYLQIPFIKKLVIETEQITFMYMLQLFIESGLSITRAVDNTIHATQNMSFKKILTKVNQSIMEGKPLFEALKSTNSSFFNEQFLALIQVGEQSGKLADVLKNAIKHYQQNLYNNLRTITNISGPLFMIFVGLLIGVLMVIIYLPIFTMGSLFNQ